MGVPGSWKSCEDQCLGGKQGENPSSPAPFPESLRSCQLLSRIAKPILCDKHKALEKVEQIQYPNEKETSVRRGFDY